MADSTPQLVVPEWDKTHNAEQHALDRGLLEEKGESGSGEKFYLGRPVISRDTPINGGVYIGVGREAIVVDDSKEGALLQSMYAEFMDQHAPTPENFKKGVMGAVFQYVRDKLPYDQDKVDKIAEQEGANAGKKISLTTYIKEGGGVCRHQALLCGYLIERLTKDESLGANRLGGKVSVDRNYIPGVGGHAWVRYVNSAGIISIIDPAQGFIGTLEESKKVAGWSYDRPPTQSMIMKVLDKVRGKK
jgi:hypothetical protein